MVSPFIGRRKQVFPLHRTAQAPPHRIHTAPVPTRIGWGFANFCGIPLHRTAQAPPHRTHTAPVPTRIGWGKPWFLYAGYGFWHVFCDVGVFHVVAVPGKAEVAFPVYDDEAAGAGGFGAE